MHRNRGISIIIPCYNAGSYLLDAVRSVQAQDFGDLPYEIIIVDDGSRDADTIRAIDRLMREAGDELAVFKLVDNLGQSAARNIGLVNARYDYVFPVDADDLLTTDPKINAKHGSFPLRAVRVLEGDQGLIAAFPTVYCFGPHIELPIERPDPYSEKRMLLWNHIPVCGVFRRDEALAVGGYDEGIEYSEDWVFWLKMIGQRFREGRRRDIHRFREPYYLYRQYEDGHSVNSRKKDYEVLMAHCYAAAPELYAHYYPDVPEADMVAFLKEKKEEGMSYLALQFRGAVLHPVWTGRRVLQKVWKAVSPSHSIIFGPKEPQPLHHMAAEHS